MDGAALTGVGPGMDSLPPMGGVGLLVAVGLAARMARSRLKIKVPTPVVPTPVEAPELRVAAGARLQLDLARTLAVALVASTVVGLVLAAQWYMLHDL